VEPLGFYEVVLVLESEATRRLGIAGQRGVVLGVPPDVLGIEDDYGVPLDEAQYAVDVGIEGYALARQDLEGTGEFVAREAFYDGSRLSVQAEFYPPEDDEAPRDD